MNSFVTEVSSMMIQNKIELNSRDQIKIDWLLDSGCTDRVINNEEYFSKCITLREPVNVKIADG